MTDEYGGAYAGGGAIHVLADDAGWRQNMDSIDSWWGNYLDGYCTNAHELTHLGS